MARKKKNWQEMILINGMANQNQPMYWELGYGVDKLFRFLHIEVVRSQWENSKAEYRLIIGGNFSFGIRPKTFDKSVEQSLSF